MFPRDIPNLPIKKPKQIARLEQTDRATLDSMPGVEVDELVEEIAHATAAAYQEQYPEGHYDECVEMVSISLTTTGSAIGGHVGNAMIAASDKQSQAVCRLLFPIQE